MTTLEWLQAGSTMMAVVLGASVACAQGDELLVTNVQAAQRPFTALVDISYDLETVGDMPVMTRLFLSTDGGVSYPELCRSVSGDVGGGVMPGVSRHIIWDAGEDHTEFSSDTCRLRVSADDSPHAGDFVFVSPGTFTMGSPANEPGRLSSEVQHVVTLTRGYYLSQYEVTEALWSEVFGGPSSQFPKVSMTWYETRQFCNALSIQEGLTEAYEGPYPDYIWNQAANGYRLPTEAEWEFACRSGTTTAFVTGGITYPLYCIDLDLNLDLIGWYCANSGGSPHEVAEKIPNWWGLFDMHGNVWECCSDWYGTYPAGPVIDPIGPETGTSRVIRGGWAYSPARDCRSARRYVTAQGSGDISIGLRLARGAD